MRILLMALLMGITLLGAIPARAHPPYGLVEDEAGNRYFSDLETVWRLSPDGKLRAFRPAVPGHHVHEVALAPDGAIEGDQNSYDPATQRFYTGLWRRSSAGAEAMIVPMTERPPPGAGVWQDRAGNRYVAHWVSSDDRRVVLLRRRPNGTVETLFDETGGTRRPAQPSVGSVGGMAFGNDGSVFFANGRLLRRLDANGAVTTLYDGGEQSSLRGLAVAPDGRVLAADMGRKVVVAIGQDGGVATPYRAPAGWLPVAVAQSGERLLVLQANADPYERDKRVRLVEVTRGVERVIASPGASPGPRTQNPQEAEGQEDTPLALLLGVAASAALAVLWLKRRVRKA